MKRYTFEQLAKRNCAECTTTITTTQKPERYYLAADVDRLREEARERVAAYMVNEQGYVETYASEVADRILAEVFKEVGE